VRAPDKGRAAIKADRIYFLDNLRTFMIFLVVLNHAGIVYESSGIGAIFWIVDDPATNNFCGILNLLIDIFVMSVMFFVSGYLVPLSMKTKTGWGLLASKLKRLMIPWAVAVLTLMPLYKVIFLYSRNLPQQHWTTYFHFNSGFSQNWLWFLPVLFVFDVMYLLLSKVKIDLSRIPLKVALPAAFVAGLAYSLCMDLFHWDGWTKTALLDFQNERLLIYFLAFLLGVLCFERRVFDSEPKGKILYFVAALSVWIPVGVYLIFLIHSFMNPGGHVLSATADRVVIWLSFQMSLVGIAYVLINTFRFYLNRQGRLGGEFSRNSYGVYIIHVIVIGGLALILLNVPIHSLLKYSALVVSSYVVSNALVSAYRRLGSVF
jgi:hypothetical protein